MAERERERQLIEDTIRKIGKVGAYEAIRRYGDTVARECAGIAIEYIKALAFPGGGLPVDNESQIKNIAYFEGNKWAGKEISAAILRARGLT